MTGRAPAAALAALLLAACAPRTPPAALAREGLSPAETARPSVFWNSATVYFLLTDRFDDADTSNDHALGRAADGAVERSFEGGDFKGVTRRIASGYFDSLGVNVIWLTPFVEQIRGSVDEGTGRTYGYHGYWARDWTAVDPALGTKADLKALVDSAHAHGIRVLMDAVINHVGPVTPEDPAWPADWVRAGPTCTYRSYVTTVDCNLVPTLPDVRTESDAPVALPPFLVEKWRREGRLAGETAGLDTFFTRTGYPRAPRYYLIKWLTDWVREFGFDGYRMDTAKHFGATVSAELKREAQRALDDWRHAHPARALDTLPFFMVGEVYGWDPSQGRTYSYGDSSVDFFDYGYDALINFRFKSDAAGSLDSLFSSYATALHTGPLHGVAMLNYLSSHDDGAPYDPDRRDPLGAATRLLLAPGAAQIYYGDETARPLKVPGARGDANLRSFMNWRDLALDTTRDILEHWRKLGRFRREHPAVGAGLHRTLQARPFIFSRTLGLGRDTDKVLVATDQGTGEKTVPVFGLWRDGTVLRDGYSGDSAVVRKGAATLATPSGLVLLAQRFADQNDTVVVFVTDNYALPMEIYALGGGTYYRMGTVNPGIESRFVVRWDVLGANGSIELVAQASGYGARAGSGIFHVSPGDVVDFVIATNLIGTYAAVRP